MKAFPRPLPPVRGTTRRAVLALASLVPQMVRIHRTGLVAGLSLTWPAVGIVGNVGWTGYVLSQDLRAAVWASGAMVVAYSIVAGQLLVRRVAWRRAATAAAGWALVLGIAVAVGAVTGVTVLGFALAIGSVAQLVPAVWAAWRDPAPAGVSAGTWTIMLVEISLWGVYGAANGDLAVTMFGVLGSAAAASMLLRRWLTRDAVAAMTRSLQAA